MGTTVALRRHFRSERAIAADETTYWVVVNESFELHVEACAYLAGLRGADRAYNTERTYAGRIALYLSYCAEVGMDWTRPSLAQLMAMMRWLIDEPLPPRGRRPDPEPRFRSKETANAIMGTVGEFLSWSALQGWVPASVVSQLVQPKFLHFAPPGFDPGEDGQHRAIQARRIKFRVAVRGYEWLSDEQITQVIDCTTHARDRFLVSLLAVAGVRIGEALGLRREDMHFLPDSTALGCRIEGPHIHVRRRLNSNGAFAKSAQPRWIPVEADTVALYADYRYERDEVSEAAGCDMVFVNLFHAPLGEPMKYPSTYELFKRLAKRAGFTARPHMFRHSAITRWVRSGVPRDVAQNMAGHAAPQSMDPYTHATDQDKRDAVKMVAAKRREARA
ncbi:tyrosine-type recombinase/integrase [Streptomyces sp. AN091965]|uniref:tyrosine-type recombinase/integrase n=1 Tax=Streptomyces sp. AN091965 TaxID=2927803 RepID=UPI001F6245AF|nr:tyrosine-type recombinase/integrase [Streptomyces sp. AN091965]MCI3932101.1 tyrosine-type recombinase/integrase [Streptomyces sp. AN091965]